MKKVMFGMYWQCYGMQEIELPDSVDADNAEEVEKYIRSEWDSIPLPVGCYVSCSDELDEEEIMVVDG